jgi:hypothetical protein
VRGRGVVPKEIIMDSTYGKKALRIRCALREGGEEQVFIAGYLSLDIYRWIYIAGYISLDGRSI